MPGEARGVGREASDTSKDLERDTSKDGDASIGHIDAASRRRVRVDPRSSHVGRLDPGSLTHVIAWPDGVCGVVCPETATEPSC